MKSMDSAQKKKFIILGCIIAVILVATISVCSAILVRSNKISNQAMNCINQEENTTTIYCSGKNVLLSKTAYNTIKENNLDLVISNKDYIAKIKNENVSRSINVDVNVKQNAEDDYDVVINTDGIVELKISVLSEKSYFSVFSNDELVTNKAKVDENGFVKIKIAEEKNSYKLVYVIPSDFELKDIKVFKGQTKSVELKMDKKEYTYGSIEVYTDSEDGIEVDGFNIIAKEVGSYKIYAKTSNEVKEAKVIVEQPAEQIELSVVNLNLIEGGRASISAKVLPLDAVNKEIIWSSSDEGVAKVEDNGSVEAIKEGNCEIIIKTKDEPVIEARVQIEVKKKNLSVSSAYPEFSPQINDATYINGILLVNKTHSIPASYAPGLHTIVYNAFLDLQAAAANAGFNISLLSGFRSYETQTYLYNNYCATYGQAAADTFSARPGTSEHQTGLAMDVGWIDDNYGNTPSGIWLAQNCYKYGFIIRYPLGKEHITGYKYEPWHIRYLGKDIAKDVYESGLCLEEYLGVLN